MSGRGCNPLRKCEVIEEQDETEFIDAKAFCYNIASKVEVCKPRTCLVRRKKGDQEDVVEDHEQLEEEKFKLLPMGPPKETCVPWKDPSVPQEDSSLEQNNHNNQENNNQLGGESTVKDGKNRQQSADQENLAAVVPAGSKEAIATENSDGKSTNVNNNAASMPSENIQGTNEMTSGKTQSTKKGSSSLNEMTSGKTQSTKKRSSSLNEGSAESIESTIEVTVPVEECSCCNCNPCECGPRGLIVENIITALKTVQSSDELSKLLHVLSPEALNIIDNILMKEGIKASLWAAGSAMSFIKGIEDENFKEALREAWIRGYFDEMSSCHCLPHMCPCPGGHRIYDAKKGELGEEMHNKRKQQKKDQRKQKQKRHGRGGPEILIKRKLSDTCICPPTKHYLTPASSGTGSSDELTVRTKLTYWRDMMICSCPRLERTLAILKPEVVHFRDVVLRAIKNYGLDILNERKVQLTPEEASELYSKYYGRTQFPNMIVSISYAPIIAFSLGGISAVESWKNITGPNGLLPNEWFLTDWIKREYGSIPDMPDTLHASGNLNSAEKENIYFFPDSIIDPVMKTSGDVEDYISKFVNPTLLKGLAILTKSRPTDPIIFLAEWLLYNNPFQPRFSSNICLAPT